MTESDRKRKKYRNWLCCLLLMTGLAACSDQQSDNRPKKEHQPVQETAGRSDEDSEKIKDAADRENRTDSVKEADLESESRAGSEGEGQCDPESQENRIRLDISQKVQETDYYCAVACLQMVLDYHGISMSQPELAGRLATHPVTGTEYEDLAREASVLIFGKNPVSEKDSGYRAVLWKQNEGSEEIRALLQQRIRADLEGGDPVFVSINNAPAYGLSADAVHEVVLYGADYDCNGNPVMYYYLDPSYTQQDAVYEGRKKVTPEELWTIMNENPEPGYVW